MQLHERVSQGREKIDSGSHKTPLSACLLFHLITQSLFLARLHVPTIRSHILNVTQQSTQPISLSREIIQAWLGGSLWKPGVLECALSEGS